MVKRPYILILFLLWTSLVSAQEKWNALVDNVMQWPVIGVVYPTYSPETNWSFGASVQACFNMPQEQIPSTFRVTGCYTLNHQWQVHASGTLYMAGETPWMLYFSSRYRDYPDRYYGWDMNHNLYSCHYKSQRADVTLQPMFRLNHNWAVGPAFDFLWEKTNLRDVDSCFTGPSETLMWGLGVATMYDTRDYVHYPTKGMMLKLLGLYYEPRLGADYRAWHVEADYRHFVTLWEPHEFTSDFDRVNRSLIFAYQVRTIAALSNQSIQDMPFQIMPTLGGEELIRGVRANMYRENVLWAVQTELRFPIFSILRGTAFVGVGDVYNTDHWQWTTPKVGYGLGLRVSVNREHINLRFDVARNSMNNNWADRNSYSFYFTVSEAF